MTKRARSVVAAATSAEMPGFIRPQLATLKAKAPSGDQWLHEIKFDGYRVQVHLNKGKKRVFTRNGLDWTKRFAAEIRVVPLLDRRVEGVHIDVDDLALAAFVHRTMGEYTSIQQRRRSSTGRFIFWLTAYSLISLPSSRFSSCWLN